MLLLAVTNHITRRTQEEHRDSTCHIGQLHHKGPAPVHGVQIVIGLDIEDS